MTPEPITLTWGTLNQGLDLGLADMAALDWEEVEDGREDMPLSINWPHYRRMEREGILQLAYLKAGAQLIGYNVFFVHAPAHHSLTKWAINDLVYLDPAYRKGATGVRLIAECESHLKALGAKLILYTVKLHRRLGPEKNRGSVGTLLERMGYSPFEASFAKRL